MLLQSFRFLLGPAGTGKTYTCVSEVAQELRRSAEGLPLIFLAPKQATFQLERQILEKADLAGYTRLHIVSFERLAYTIFKMAETPIPPLLSEQGRVMVLRSILSRLSGSLSVFQKSSRMPGFAEELSSQIRELEHYGISPAKIKDFIQQPGTSPFRAKDKLADLQLVYSAYHEWLTEAKLAETERLLPLATDILRASSYRFGGLWLDGFANFTQAELHFLGTLLPRCQSATLAFCLEGEADDGGNYSQWSVLLKSYRQCRNKLAEVAPELKPTVQLLSRVRGQNRFDDCEELYELERCWAKGRSVSRDSTPNNLRLVECSNPEAEALFCAREIRKAIRAGDRYREMAVLVRDLEQYHHVLAKVFTRFEIPFFLDRREPVAHHPLAELTRGALRTFANGWETPSLFAALKSGLIPVEPILIDLLENSALQHGWQGKTWEKPIELPEGSDSQLAERLESTRKRAVLPFLKLQRKLGNRFNGLKLAEALNEFWETFDVPAQLERWNQDVNHPIHETVWGQMQQWLEDVKLAFAKEEMTLNDWLKVLESGLNTLTVGVIPPVLDHVLLGAVDRSRNPDLKTLYILGFNEGVFPAAPSEATLLNDRDRTWLNSIGVELGSLVSDQLSSENFFGYIAVTRPRQNLVISYSAFDSKGIARNRSRFVARLQQIYPSLKPDTFVADNSLEHHEHYCEAIPLLMANQHLLEQFDCGGSWGETASRMRALSTPATPEKISAELAEKLYSKVLLTSVSSLEKYAECPFQFFINSGLSAKERMIYEFDVREQGSFQHEVLSEFHRELKDEGKQWRELSIDEAKKRIGKLADEQMKVFRGGLLLHNESNRFLGEAFKRSLQQFVASMIGWLDTNEFDPTYVELPFGPKYGDDSDENGQEQLKPWVVKLKDGRELWLQGRVDRIDVLKKKDGLAYVVVDYKLGGKHLDRVLVHHGVQQQLPAYLQAFSQLENATKHFGTNKLIPAGIFFVKLSTSSDQQTDRNKAMSPDAVKEHYPHIGIFKQSFLQDLDKHGPDNKSGQFDYSINKNGQPRKGSFNCLPDNEFDSLLANTETLIRKFGNEVYEGIISISPYRKSTKTACDRCQYHGICRTDSWTQKYRDLSLPTGKESK